MDEWDTDLETLKIDDNEEYQQSSEERKQIGAWGTSQGKIYRTPLARLSD